MARLEQARALLSLGLSDRAWIRLKDVVESGEGGSEAHLLTAELFLRRGWHRRARQEVEFAISEDPDDPHAQALYRAAIEAQPLPDPPARLDDVDDTDALIALAERFLANGEPLNAARALERARQRAPNHPRVADLQWGLDGDFSLGFPSLSAACDAFLPLIQLPEFTDEVEHTESGVGRLDAVLADLAPAARGAFPDLFRGGSGPAVSRTPVGESWREEHDHDDQTHALNLAARGEGADLEATDSGRGDTDIQLVIRRDGRDALARPRGRIHVDPGAAVPKDFSLDAWRRENAEDPGLEDEDDERIVLTGRERAHVPQTEPSPTTDLELTDPGPPPETKPAPAVLVAPKVEEEPSDDYFAASWWLLVMGVMMWLGAVVLLVAVAYRFWR